MLSRARRALETGVDGIVSSGLEAPMIRQELGERLLVVTPGIRPVENRPVDDQKRTVDVAQAFLKDEEQALIAFTREAAERRKRAEERRKAMALPRFELQERQ